MEKILNIELLDFLFRAIIDLSVASLLIFGIYKVEDRRKSFVFSLFIFNLIVFIIGYALNNIAINAGTGLGLFAVFAMLRYRSEALSFKEMTYLFMLIALGMVNSLKDGISISIMISMNLILVCLTYLMEKKAICRVLQKRKLKYNNLELIKPQFKNLLLIDIFKKTGIRAKDIEVESLSFNDQTANIVLYYDDQESVNTKISFEKLHDIEEFDLKQKDSAKIMTLQN